MGPLRPRSAVLRHPPAPVPPSSRSAQREIALCARRPCECQVRRLPLSSGSFFEFSISSRIFCADLSAKRSRLSRVGFRQLVNVGNILHQPALGQLRNQRVPHAIDIHHSARGEVQNRSQQLGGTICVHTAVVDFAFGADDFVSANLALLGILDFFVSARMLFIEPQQLLESHRRHARPEPSRRSSRRDGGSRPCCVTSRCERSSRRWELAPIPRRA